MEHTDMSNEKQENALLENKLNKLDDENKQIELLNPDNSIPVHISSTNNNDNNGSGVVIDRAKIALQQGRRNTKQKTKEPSTAAVTMSTKQQTTQSSNACNITEHTTLWRMLQCAGMPFGMFYVARYCQYNYDISGLIWEYYRDYENEPILFGTKLTVKSQKTRFWKIPNKSKFLKISGSITVVRSYTSWHSIKDKCLNIFDIVQIQQECQSQDFAKPNDSQLVLCSPGGSSSVWHNASSKNGNNLTDLGLFANNAGNILISIQHSQGNTSGLQYCIYQILNKNVCVKSLMQENAIILLCLGFTNKIPNEFYSNLLSVNSFIWYYFKKAKFIIDFDNQLFDNYKNMEVHKNKHIKTIGHLFPPCWKLLCSFERATNVPQIEAVWWQSEMSKFNLKKAKQTSINLVSWLLKIVSIDDKAGNDINDDCIKKVIHSVVNDVNAKESTYYFDFTAILHFLIPLYSQRHSCDNSIWLQLNCLNNEHNLLGLNDIASILLVAIHSTFRLKPEVSLFRDCIITKYVTHYFKNDELACLMCKLISMLLMHSTSLKLLCLTIDESTKTYGYQWDPNGIESKQNENSVNSRNNIKIKNAQLCLRDTLHNAVFDLKSESDYYLNINKSDFDKQFELARKTENKLKDYNRAKSHFEIAVSLKPSKFEPHFLLATLLKNKMKDFNAAKDQILSALRLCTSEQWKKAQSMLGDIKIHLKRPENDDSKMQDSVVCWMLPKLDSSNGSGVYHNGQSFVTVLEGIVINTQPMPPNTGKYQIKLKVDALKHDDRQMIGICNEKRDQYIGLLACGTSGIYEEEFPNGICSQETDIDYLFGCENEHQLSAGDVALFIYDSDESTLQWQVDVNGKLQTALEIKILKKQTYFWSAYNYLGDLALSSITK